MTERLPLFPLGTVLFPGMVLPLRLFEERYLALLRDLLDRPAPRRFGVVAIELGHEVGPGAARRLAEVGCVADLREARARPDGRYDVVTVGRDRFRTKGVDSSGPYPRAEVEHLPEEAGADAAAAAERALAAFRVYRHRMAAVGAPVPEVAGLADGRDAVAVSYDVAAAVVLDGPDKQRLLAAGDAARRLAAARALLARENRLLRAFPTLPAGPFLDGSFHPN
ncbi:LON peptidase substrate-binding domain-containing protein [Actinomadura atramentaria]|uniref:LON peptidase substrate-binding domain-containing protein n=1 Tax=Actinomadura atramentaria TaxID=1990 RepID=UPI000376B906|nr:LON peptidase substrate-binding domain-containing protein [Actinomadura atramentaria]